MSFLDDALVSEVEKRGRNRPYVKNIAERGLMAKRKGDEKRAFLVASSSAMTFH